jgi:hypothetical protein
VAAESVQIEPGDLIPIEYGNGHTIIAKALSGRGKRKLMQLLEELQGVQESKSNIGKVFDLAEQAFLLCVPDATDGQIEKMDEKQQLEIAGKVLASTVLTDEQRKKLESLH